MNSQKLKTIIKQISIEKHIDFNTLLRLYMYDRFLERLSISKYNDNFIIKGGFYISALYGLSNRSTIDIDTTFTKADFDKDTIISMIKEIVNININDGAVLYYENISEIMDEDEYGGFRVDIKVENENIVEKFHIDIATGDIITPSAIIYKYLPLLGNKYIELNAYNVETMLAEKLETILSRAETNGRMKDYYDIYLIYSRSYNNINISILKEAITNTFNKRNHYPDYEETINIIKNSNILANRWQKYKESHSYAANIEYLDIVNIIKIILMKIANI